jgi:tRNA(adenine34) deaminase
VSALEVSDLEAFGFDEMRHTNKHRSAEAWLIDAIFMAKALVQAQRAFDLDEVPIGAVVVVKGKIVGRGFNKSIHKSDPTAHAEILALRQAARRLGNYRLTSATLYCTLEPCSMCAGALIWARLARLVYAAKDPKAGAIDSHLRLAETRFSNHRFEVVSGVMEAEAAVLLRQFFQARRRRP